VVYVLFHVITDIYVDVVFMLHMTQCCVACRDAGSDKMSFNPSRGRAMIECWINFENL